MDLNAITEQAMAAYGRAKSVVTQKTEEASKTVQREMRIANLSQEKKKLFYALGQEVYQRVKGETNDPYVARLEEIDREIKKLSRN